MHVLEVLGVLVLVAMAVAIAVAVWRWPSRHSPEGPEGPEGPGGPGGPGDPVTVAVATVMRRPKDLDLWLDRNRAAGVSAFYVRMESPGESPGALARLRAAPDVAMLELVEPPDEGFPFGDLQTRQIAFVGRALAACRQTWLVHIDADELLSGDVPRALGRIGPDLGPTAVIPNREARFADVPTADHACFEAAELRECALGACASYANGKPAGRVGAPGLALSGPHRFEAPGATHAEARGAWVDHYESCDFEGFARKFRRLAAADAARDAEIPFPYYQEAIAAARSRDDPEGALRAVYRRHRVVADVVADE